MIVTSEGMDMLKRAVVICRATNACVNVGNTLSLLRSIVDDT